MINSNRKQQKSNKKKIKIFSRKSVWENNIFLLKGKKNESQKMCEKYTGKIPLNIRYSIFRFSFFLLDENIFQFWVCVFSSEFGKKLVFWLRAHVMVRVEKDARTSVSLLTRTRKNYIVGKYWMLFKQNNFQLDKYFFRNWILHVLW